MSETPVQTTIVETAPSPEMAELVVSSGLEKTKAQTILESFTTFFELAATWEKTARSIVINDASQTREMKLARETRLALREIRLDAEKTKDKLKENILREGKLIQGIYNMILNVCEPIEKELLEKEKFIELQEEKRKAALKADREEQLKKYGVETSFYDLGNMPEANFNQLLENSRLAHESKEAAAKKVEEDRIAKEKAEAEAQEKIRKENERLKAEAKKKEDALAAERVKAAAVKAAAEEKLRKEREAATAKAAKLKAEQDAKLAKEKEAREKVERELAAKKAAEEKAKRDEEAAAKKAAAASDQKKLQAFAVTLEALQFPEVKDPKAQDVLAQVKERLRTLAILLRQDF